MSELHHFATREQLPETKQRFGDWVRSHAPIIEENEEVQKTAHKPYSVAPGCLDIPATSLKAYNGGDCLQVEFYGSSVMGQDALMTLLQDEGGDVSLYINKPRKIIVSEEYLSRILERLDNLELSGDILPIEDGTEDLD